MAGCTSLIIVLSLLIELSIGSHQILVTTDTATYSGLKVKYGRTEYYSFRGVRYGQAQRFKGATQEVPTKEVQYATSWGAQCMQPGEAGEIYGSEDCLFLNINTCNITGNVPVIVYIHGGGFMRGNGSIYADYWMVSSKIVYVTIQYRLGPFGFMDFNSNKYPSNLGLRDQILALQWIKQKISYFGGDPDKVTIQGNSAGGVSVSLLTLSPAAEGLFRAAISHSGNACSPWGLASKSRARMVLSRYVRQTYCFWSVMVLGDTDSANLAAECLMRFKPEYLVLTMFNMIYDVDILLLPFQPVVEEYESFGENILEQSENNPVVTSFPGDVSSKKGTVPWINTINSEEGQKISDLGLPEIVISFVYVALDALIPHLLLYTDTSNQNIITKSIKTFYLKDRELSKEIFMTFLSKVVSDGLFSYPAYRCQDIYKEAPVYSLNFGKPLPYMNRTVVGHGEELPFFFNRLSSQLDDIRWMPIERTVSVTLINIFTSFAVNLKPSLDLIEWESWPTSKKKVLQVNPFGTFMMADEPRKEAIQFWHQIRTSNFSRS